MEYFVWSGSDTDVMTRNNGEKHLQNKLSNYVCLLAAVLCQRMYRYWSLFSVLCMWPDYNAKQVAVSAPGLVLGWCHFNKKRGAEKAESLTADHNAPYIVGMIVPCYCCHDFLMLESEGIPVPQLLIYPLMPWPKLRNESKWRRRSLHWPRL